MPRTKMNQILIVYAQKIEDYKKHFISMLEAFLAQKSQTAPAKQVA
ncbi:MAG: hypothetical protein ACRCXC_09375 [Legionella sp.]